MIRVFQEVKVYRRDGKDARLDDVIHVNSHHNFNDRVILLVDGVEIEVVADDLETAIKNAQNINRF